MGEVLEAPAPKPEFASVAAMLGGPQVLHHRLGTSLDAHALLLRGLPGEALRHLVGSFVTLQMSASLERAIGMSLRTYQRRRDAPAQPLSPEQSGRVFRFAEILAKATAVLGSRAEAELWLERPATGLDQCRPLDLLATPAGTALVQDFLDRLEYGVYV